MHDPPPAPMHPLPSTPEPAPEPQPPPGEPEPGGRPAHDPPLRPEHDRGQGAGPGAPRAGREDRERETAGEAEPQRAVTDAWTPDLPLDEIVFDENRVPG
jgi:hypothetical protein